MTKQLCGWILYKWMGWKKTITVPLPQKCIVCLAPHTSNFDFILGQLYARAEGWKINFLMKREWFFPPLGYMFKGIGGIPVWRDKHTSMTENLANEAKNSDNFRLCITPEGTRSLNPDWKKGFYYIALNADIPILLYGVDYKKKEIECTKMIVPTGNIEQDMIEIKQYFKRFHAKHPKLFTIGYNK